MTSVHLAPAPPGRLGQPLDPGEAQTFILDLDDWVRARRTELDALDSAALGAGRGEEIASDMALSLAVWQAVQRRYQQLNATFDGGRVGPVEAERLSTLVWGRLDGDLGSGLAVSLPEACRLSDALLGQIRARLALVPGADAAAARIKDLRAQLERIRDQVELEPAHRRAAARADLERLDRRLLDAVERAQRGADVGGLLPPLEQDAAVFERDLIVGNAERRELREELQQTRDLLGELRARSVAVAQLAQQCVEAVDPAPRYAVPDVAALGEVPSTPAEIAAFRTRLGRVEQALGVAERAYADALAQRQEVSDLLDALCAKARAHGLADHDDLSASEAKARSVLDRRPTPISVARSLVAAYQSWLTHALTEESA